MPKGYVRRQNKIKVVTMTGDGKLSKNGLAKVRQAVDKAIDKGYFIFTSDAGELDQEVVRRTNSVKYARVVVWGAGGSLKWFSNAGKNKPVEYKAAQRDDVLISRSDFVVLSGKTRRIREMRRFGLNMGRKVGVINE